MLHRLDAASAAAGVLTHSLLVLSMYKLRYQRSFSTFLIISSSFWSSSLLHVPNLLNPDPHSALEPSAVLQGCTYGHRDGHAPDTSVSDPDWSDGPFGQRFCAVLRVCVSSSFVELVRKTFLILCPPDTHSSALQICITVLFECVWRWRPFRFG